MLLEATDVRQVSVGSITDDDARRAGAADAASLRKRMKVDDDDQLVWRVELLFVGQDDRIERRNADDLSPEDVADLRARLERLDRRSPTGPWARSTLRLIEKYPGVVSTVLADHANQERPVFKLNVRKLKELGLTESLDVGYRLSPRGEAVLRALRE